MSNPSLNDRTTSAVVSYNGFSFGDENSTPPTYRLHGQPVYDQARRVVTHVCYTVSISTIVYADQQSETASWVQQLREQLSRPGRALELTELGLGDTTVSPHGSHPDLLWGARPQEIELTPIGTLPKQRMARIFIATKMRTTSFRPRTNGSRRLTGMGAVFRITPPRGVKRSLKAMAQAAAAGTILILPMLRLPMVPGTWVVAAKS